MGILPFKKIKDSKILEPNRKKVYLFKTVNKNNKKNQ